MLHDVTPYPGTPYDGYAVAGPSDDLGYQIQKNPKPVLMVEPGEYRIGKIAETAGGQGKVVRAITKGSVRILGGDGDTVALTGDGESTGPISFEGLVIEGSARAAIITNNKPATPFDLRVAHCVLDGMYDHDVKEGPDTKWGMILHRTQFYIADSVIRRFKDEHGIYPHTLAGDSYCVRTRFEHNGRTGVQVVGRNEEAGYSEFKLGITDCVFEDNGLKDGGAQLTAGGVAGVVVQGSRFYFGRDKGFVQRYMETHPEKLVFGQRHIANWSDKGRQDPTWMFALHDVLAWSAPGTGHASAISISNSERVQLSGELHVSSGWNPTAIEIDGAAVDWSGLELLNLQGAVVLK